MSLYNYLCDKFGKNNPFFTSDIEYMDYSKPWIYKELNKLCGESKIIRFERGLYYIPEETIFGPSILNPNKIIEKKYILICGCGLRLDNYIFESAPFNHTNV